MHPCHGWTQFSTSWLFTTPIEKTGTWQHQKRRGAQAVHFSRHALWLFVNNDTLTVCLAFHVIINILAIIRGNTFKDDWNRAHCILTFPLKWWFSPSAALTQRRYEKQEMYPLRVGSGLNPKWLPKEQNVHDMWGGDAIISYHMSVLICGVEGN